MVSMMAHMTLSVSTSSEQELCHGAVLWDHHLALVNQRFQEVLSEFFANTNVLPSVFVIIAKKI
jgi:hypothetical protein